MTAKQKKPEPPKWPGSMLWSLDKIKPYPNNARTHPPEQIELLANLISKFGADQPIVVDEDGVILKGHGRRLAALQAGLKKFPVVQHFWMSEDDKRALRIADNQSSLLSGWDQGLLEIELQELKLANYDMPLLGFGGEELASFGFGVAGADFPELSSADRQPFQQVSFLLHDTQVELVRAALQAAKAEGPFEGPNENSNGNALARICAAYGEGHQGRANPAKRRERAG